MGAVYTQLSLKDAVSYARKLVMVLSWRHIMAVFETPSISKRKDMPPWPNLLLSRSNCHWNFHQTR